MLFCGRIYYIVTIICKVEMEEATDELAIEEDKKSDEEDEDADDGVRCAQRVFLSSFVKTGSQVVIV